MIHIADAAVCYSHRYLGGKGSDGAANPLRKALAVCVSVKIVVRFFCQDPCVSRCAYISDLDPMKVTGFGQKQSHLFWDAWGLC